MHRLLAVILVLPFVTQCADAPIEDDDEHGEHTEFDPEAFENITIKNSGTVRDLRRQTCAGTAGAHPLSRQIAQSLTCLRPGQFGRIDDIANISLNSGALPFLEKKAADALRRASQSAHIKLNSTWRSVIQQYLLDSWEGTSCVSIAATPGRSQHESGLAIDVQNYDDSNVRRALKNAGFTWYCDSRNGGRLSGCRDKPHFTYSGGGTNVGGDGVRAFQRLYNKNNPGSAIAEDGAWGGNTRSAADRAPLNGFSSPIVCGDAPSEPPSAQPRPNGGDRFIGEDCDDDDQCFAGGSCYSGPQVQMCTSACDGFCPDRAGHATTFCIDASAMGGAGGGLCTVKADARNDFCLGIDMVAADLPRYTTGGAPASLAKVCVPNLQAAPPPAPQPEQPEPQPQQPEPEPQQPEPEPQQPEPEQPPRAQPVACGDIDFLGECQGDVAVWCEGGQLRSTDCGRFGLACDWIDDQVGWYCEE